MSLYGRIFASMYDRLMAGSEKAGLGDRRAALLAEASGKVLEVGAGTGVNLQYYTDAVTELVMTEPEEPMAGRLDQKALASSLPVTVVRAPAEALPFPDASFDAVVCTLVLCTVADPDRSIAEIQRVLRPGGRLLFLEHVRSDDPGLARWQDRVVPFWRRFGHGCHPNRPTPQLIREAGFEAVEIEAGEFPKAPPIVRPLAVGRAISR
jgi:ubiquinone/menaquinone biosynthesis C-methylase UbiE